VTAPAIEPQGPAAHPWVAEARHTVGFSLVGAFLRGWAELRDFVVRAEELGFDAYWANDHPSRSMDCWTQLAALAAVTTRIRLISLVSCVYYRSPVLLARQAADVDLVSGGRLVLGLGIGDDVAEFRQLGLDFPAPAERLDALAETIDVTRGLWDSPLTRHRLAGAQVRPGPVQQPRVPILIGGGGERTTLRLVARYADVSNFGAHEWTGGAFGVDDVRRKCDILRQDCLALARATSDPYTRLSLLTIAQRLHTMANGSAVEFDSILRSHYTPLLTLAGTASELERKRRAARIPDAGLRTAPVFATVEDAIAHYQALVDAGMQYFLATVDGRDAETVDLVARRLRPALKAAK